MGITSASVYSRYNSALENLRNGSIDYREALKIDKELSREASGLTVRTVQRGQDLTRIPDTEIPSNLLRNFNEFNAQYSMSSAAVSEAYKNSEHLDKPLKRNEWKPYSDAELDVSTEKILTIWENELLGFSSGEKETVLLEKVERLMSGLSDRMKKFEPFLDKMKTAGVSIEDLSRALISKNKEGQFGDWANLSGKSEEIAHFINDNPAVYAAYDAEHQQYLHGKS